MARPNGAVQRSRIASFASRRMGMERRRALRYLIPFFGALPPLLQRAAISAAMAALPPLDSLAHVDMGQRVERRQSGHGGRDCSALQEGG